EEGDESAQDNVEAGDNDSVGNTSKVEHNNGNVKSKQSSTEITDTKSSTEKIEEASGDGSGEGAEENEENVEEGTQKADGSKSSKLEHKTTPDFAFSIDSHAKEDVSKGKTTAASDQHAEHKAVTNSKNQQKKMFNPWMTPTIQ
ncbi:unnamed protein product, partial [Anisakis simplex]|uniref:Triadin n=1 Tax=Anisakis simplex TaxID=6269 RepID=A0A0M3KKL8_ANISI